MKYLLLFFSLNCFADIKNIDGVYYGNVCRSGNVYSVRYDVWGVVGKECKVLRLDGTIFAIGRITYE